MLGSRGTGKVRVTAGPAILTSPGVVHFLLPSGRAKPGLPPPPSSQEAGLSAGRTGLWDALGSSPNS